MSSKKKQKRSQKSPLPLQYQFVSKTTAPPVPNRRSPPGVSDYPPPRQLFQDSEAQTQAASGPLHQPSPPPQSRRSETSATRRSLSSSQAQDSASTESPEAVEPTLSDEQTLTGSLIDFGLLWLALSLNNYLCFILTYSLFCFCVLRFGRDKGKLTRRITKTFTKKFDEAYYSWSVVPQNKRETIFVEFAKTHTWDQIHTGIVQKKFEAVCQQRMKDMVSVRRRSRVRPSWIHGELWEQMIAVRQHQTLGCLTGTDLVQTSTTPARSLSNKSNMKWLRNWADQLLLVKFSWRHIQEMMGPLSI
ncbi:hypothetical protein Bca52824_081229 [Brassica carinata]|uniref:Uncharacterized protein n=1 Tax=Brassica carinata TaxID=52824 RepID=A0A8X7PIB4_BRACI|nr:hypothetical protein Bca52824_081229 [Brassica carinata]